VSLVSTDDQREPAYTRPSEIDDERGWFDRLADVTAGLVSRAPFFLAVVAGISAWFLVGVLDGFSNRLLNVGMVGMTLTPSYLWRCSRTSSAEARRPSSGN
jgi:hypothetical protein